MSAQRPGYVAVCLAEKPIRCRLQLNNVIGAVEPDTGAEVKIRTCLGSGLPIRLAADRMSRWLLPLTDMIHP